MAHLLLPAREPEALTDEDVPLCATPLRFVVDSGWRPVLTAEVNGVEVPMLVHANAGFLAMLTHDALLRVTGRRAAKESEFGLGHDLRPSAAGRGHTEVESLTVAGRSLSKVGLEIFDLPTTNWEGMLGVEWLAAVRAVVDFGRALLTVPYDDGDRPVATLGDRRIAMRRDARTGRFLCRLAVGPHGGAPGRFVASTVAETSLDVDYARRSGIRLGEPVDEEHGPTGAVVPVYRPTEPVALWHGGAVLTSLRPTIYDLYAYGATPRPDPDACIAGYIGADLLLKKRAIIDFGSGGE